MASQSSFATAGYASLFIAIEDLDQIRGMIAAAEEPMDRAGAFVADDVFNKPDHFLGDSQSRDEYGYARRVGAEKLRSDSAD